MRTFFGKEQTTSHPTPCFLDNFVAQVFGQLNDFLLRLRVATLVADAAKYARVQESQNEGSSIVASNLSGTRRSV